MLTSRTGWLHSYHVDSSGCLQLWQWPSNRPTAAPHRRRQRQSQPGAPPSGPSVYFSMCQSECYTDGGVYVCVCCRRGKRRWCWRSVMAEGTWWELCCPVELRWTCVTMTALQRSCVPVNTDTWILCGSCCLCRAVTPRSLIMWLSLCYQAWFHLHLLNSFYLLYCFSLSIFASFAS